MLEDKFNYLVGGLDIRQHLHNRPAAVHLAGYHGPAEHLARAGGPHGGPHNAGIGLVLTLGVEQRAEKAVGARVVQHALDERHFLARLVLEQQPLLERQRRPRVKPLNVRDANLELAPRALDRRLRPFLQHELVHRHRVEPERLLPKIALPEVERAGADREILKRLVFLSVQVGAVEVIEQHLGGVRQSDLDFGAFLHRARHVRPGGQSHVLAPRRGDIHLHPGRELGHLEHRGRVENVLVLFLELGVCAIEALTLRQRVAVCVLQHVLGFLLAALGVLESRHQLATLAHALGQRDARAPESQQPQNEVTRAVVRAARDITPPRPPPDPPVPPAAPRAEPALPRELAPITPPEMKLPESSARRPVAPRRASLMRRFSSSVSRSDSRRRRRSAACSAALGSGFLGLSNRPTACPHVAVQLPGRENPKCADP